MLKEERLAKLLEILEKDEFATVKSLSEQLNVSMPTIRRDLSELAAQNRILRSHGGAMRPDDRRVVTPVDYRRSVNAKEKSLLAKAASQFLHNDSVVFIDASTTVAYLMEYLDGFRNLIIVTNSLMAAVHLKNLGVRTYCLGGEVISSSVAVGGRIAIDTAATFNIDTMFFSSYGVSPQGIIVDTSESENELRRYMLEHASTSVFLCDKTKFGKNAVFNLASLNEVDYMITNEPLPQSFPKVCCETIIAE